MFLVDGNTEMQVKNSGVIMMITHNIKNAGKYEIDALHNDNDTINGGKYTCTCKDDDDDDSTILT
jgi:hypothetical protein